MLDKVLSDLNFILRLLMIIGYITVSALILSVEHLGYKKYIKDRFKYHMVIYLIATLPSVFALIFMFIILFVKFS